MTYSEIHRDRPAKTVTLDRSLVNKIDCMCLETGLKFSQAIEKLARQGFIQTQTDLAQIDINSSTGQNGPFWLKNILLCLIDIDEKLDKLVK